MSSVQPYRLAEKGSEKSGTINFGRVLNFTFNGRRYCGYEGDSLASALLANGVHFVGRSFKYHRPRGIMSSGSEESNALVQLCEGALSEPNMQAPCVELYDGLRASSQNCFPWLHLDFMALNSLFGRILPSGFYYKTFMWPKSFWMGRFGLGYEHIIRRIAGLGRAPIERDVEHYERLHSHCDILVVGGGACGLMSAYVAAVCGADVIVADEGSSFGGSLLYSGAQIGGKGADEWLSSMVRKLAAMDNVRLLLRTTVTGYYQGNFVTALERVSDHVSPADRVSLVRRCFHKIRAKQVILAQGSIERPMIFANNDRPGIMLAGAVGEYLRRYRVLCGSRVLLYTNNDSVYSTAVDLAGAGVFVTIADVREQIPVESLELAKANDITVHRNCAVTQVGGFRRVSRVVLNTIDPAPKIYSVRDYVLRCDLVAMSGGWTPSVHLFSQAGGKLSYDSDAGAFVPDIYPVGCHCVGASNGVFGLRRGLEDCVVKAIAACRKAGFKGVKTNVPTVSGDDVMDIAPSVWVDPDDEHEGKAFIDFQNDVTAQDIVLAHREGYQSVEHLKRYTTTGMGTDQGKTSNMNALALMAGCRGVAIGEVGTTTFRPPFTGLTFGAIAGRNRGDLFAQKRTSAMHAAHVSCGAIFEDVGDWKRPRYFPIGDESMDSAVRRECYSVRQSVGMLDASTLGKIDIRGRDSVKLLNMLYTNAWDKLAIGRCRYGVMLNEDGMIFDDGVTTRLGAEHFHMTTTTGGAARVLTWIEEWLQTEWPSWRVYCTSVSEQWSVATVSGVNARALLSRLSDIDLSSESFPFMSMREGLVAGISARVFRISFTGDLAYEINVPARYGLALWDALRRVGIEYDLCLYGTETMHVLRAEKGFIIVGQDTDGTVTPHDAGMSWLVSHKKDDFLGKRSLYRSSTSAESGRKQLVGVLPVDSEFVLPEGSHIVESLSSTLPMDMLGHVTSSYYSVSCGRSIAMAVIKDGFRRRGERYYVALMDGSYHEVVIADSAVFYDSEGVRQDG